MLSKVVIDTIKEFKTIKALESSIFQTRLQVAIVSKNPLYISDGEVSCQCILKNKNQNSQNLKPFNNAKTPYYAIQMKLWKWFNFKDSQAIQQVQFPHAYQPQFYYKTQEIQQYVKKRDTINSTQGNEIIRINKWAIKIINVSCSGYYAPVILVYDHQYTRDFHIPIRLVTSILFNSEMQRIMEQFRVEDMKTFLKEKEKEKMVNQNQKISLCYYTKNAKVITVPGSISSFAKADTEGKYLKYDKESHDVSYVPLGSVSGVCRFMKSLSKKSQNKIVMNFNEFPQIQERRLESSDDQNDSGSLWSDSEVQEKEGAEEEIKSVQMDEISQQQSSEDEQPLKLLYMNEMKKKSIL